jgi:fatty-acid desaturase
MSETSFDAEIAEAAAAPESNEGWRLEWFVVFGMVLYHALALLAFTPWFFSWTGVIVAIAGHYIIALPGISLSYHRQLTHRAFTTPRWLEYTLAIFGVCCALGPPTYWAAVHRRHHALTDGERDPHSPQEGFFWSHIAWLAWRSDSMQRGVVTRRYVKDLLRDPFYVWLERYWAVIVGISWMMFFAGGFWAGKLQGMTTADAVHFGIAMVLWGCVVRALITWHSIWAVNSAGHLWGYRNYDTRESSRNNPLVAMLVMGEGWHNNHHAAPSAAIQGHRWWEWDPSWRIIQVLAALGLAKDIVMPPPRRMR